MFPNIEKSAKIKSQIDWSFYVLEKKINCRTISAIDL